MFRLKIFLMSLVVSLGSCTDPGHTTDRGTDGIYADYSVRSAEGDDRVTILLLFRAGGVEGGTVRLQSPAIVRLDGEQITADSAAHSGVYYEVVKPLAEFSGRHQISYSSADGKVHEQEFYFQPPALMQKLPGEMVPDSFRIQFAKRSVENATAHLFITDTAFSTEDVNLRLPLTKDAVWITPAMLQPLRPGPVVLELFLEEATPIPSFPGAGGKLSVEYGLKKEFILLPAKAKR